MMFYQLLATQQQRRRCCISASVILRGDYREVIDTQRNVVTRTKTNHRRLRATVRNQIHVPLGRIKLAAPVRIPSSVG